MPGIAIRRLLIVVVLLAGFRASGQRYSFKEYGEAEGLTNKVVTVLFQDRQGFLWVGTENGLYRYDGSRFVLFDEAAGLPHSFITALTETTDGTIWAATVGGLAWKRGQRFHASKDSLFKGVAPGQGLGSDGQGRLYVTTPKGLARGGLSAKGDALQLDFLPPPPGTADAFATSVLVESDQSVWYGCGKSICQIRNGQVKVWGAADGLPPDRWQALRLDGEGNLWARSRKQLAMWRRASGRFVPQADPAVRPVLLAYPSLCVDRRSRVFTPSDKGLAVRSGAGWSVLGRKQGLPIDGTTAVLEDREGSIWIGVSGAGLVRWLGDREWESFTEAEGLAGNDVLSILGDPATGVWAGTNAGLSRGLLRDGVWDWRRVPVSGVEGIRGVCRSKDGALWIGSHEPWIVRYDPRSNAVRRVGPVEGLVSALFVDSGNRLWVATSAGLYRGGPLNKNMALERLRPPDADRRPIFLGVTEGPGGDIWIASFTGLYRFATDRWTRYTSQNGLRSDLVSGVSVAPDGEAWITYRDAKGVTRLREMPTGPRWEHLGRAQGMPSDLCLAIGFDNRGRTWAATDRGLAVREDGRWLGFTRADGLIWDEANIGAIHADASGGVWIGSSRGLSRFQPPAQLLGSSPPRVTLVETRFGMEVVDSGAPGSVETRARSLHVRFSVLSFPEEAAFRFRYRLRGSDGKWKETTQRELDFAPLSPGTYRLELAAFSPKSGWSAAPATLSFRVLPLWYESFWFRGLVILALAGTAAAFWRWRVRRLEKDRQALEDTVAVQGEELRQEKTRVQIMYEQAPDGHFLCELDGTLRDMNRAAEKLTGQRRQSAAGRNCHDAGLWFPEHLDKIGAMLARNAMGRPAGPEELVLVREDGERVDVEARTFPVEMKGKNLVLGSLRDISARKRAEKELRESERRIRELLQTVHMAAVMLDAEGRITFVNDHLLWLTGWSRKEAQGKDWFETFIPEEDREKARAGFQALMDGAGIAHAQGQILARLGGRRLIEWDISLLRDPLGGAIGVASLGRDITEQKALKERYLQSQKLESIGRLAGGVAHDFNNLLTVINGYGDLLLNQLGQGEPPWLQVQQIRKAGERAAGLTRQLLAFSRRQIVQFQPLDLNAVVREAGMMLRRLVREDIEVITRLDPALGMVRADSNQIHQVLLNLVVNARDAMPSGGKLTIETKSIDADGSLAPSNDDAVSGPCALLSVTDTGVGMDEDTRQHIFEPFFTTKRTGQGTGLGLSMVWGIVKQSGGWIGVSSEPGKGTSFQICLPCIDTGAGTEDSARAEDGLCHGSETVLVAEDQDEVRNIATQVLRGCGYAVLEACDGMDALRLAESRPDVIHLMVTDIVMPGMNGWDLAERMRAARPDIKVLYVSGYPEDPASRQRLNDPGVAYLPKPFTPAGLAAAVRELLGTARDAAAGSENCAAKRTLGD